MTSDKFIWKKGDFKVTKKNKKKPAPPKGELQSFVDGYIITRFDLGGRGSGNFRHKGRKGQRGGSDNDGVPNASDKSKGSSTTPKKVANSLSKSFGIKMSSGARFGGSSEQFKGYTSLNKQPTIEKALTGAGFQQFKHPNRQDFVTSFTNGSIGVDLSKAETMDGDRLMVTVYPYSPKYDIPFIPYD